MTSPHATLANIAALLCLASPALATHEIIAHGEVLFSNISAGPLAGITPGTPAQFHIIVQNTPAPITPGQVNAYSFDFTQTRLDVGSVELHLSSAAPQPVLYFQNDNQDDGGSDGFETVPDVVSFANSTYQMRIHCHDIQGVTFSSALIDNNAGTYPGHTFHHLTWTVYDGIAGMLITLNDVQVIPGQPDCDSIDYNNDGLFPDTADIDDFLSVFAGGPCSTNTCADIDYNNDGLFPDTADIDAFLRVFAGGACTL